MRKLGRGGWSCWLLLFVATERASSSFRGRGTSLSRLPTITGYWQTETCTALLYRVSEYRREIHSQKGCTESGIFGVRWIYIGFGGDWIAATAQSLGKGQQPFRLRKASCQQHNKTNSDECKLYCAVLVHAIQPRTGSSPPQVSDEYLLRFWKGWSPCA